MKLTDLDPHFLKHSIEKAPSYHGRKLPDGSTQWGGFDTSVFEYVDLLAEADGITFLCPKCFQQNGGRIGTHSIHIYFQGRNVPPEIGRNKKGETVRWIVNGTGLHDLTTQPSILMESGCEWHGFITNGEVT